MHALRAGKGRRVHFVPAREPACRAAARVTCDAGSGLARLAVQAHGEHALGLHVEGDFVCDDDLARRYGEVALAADGDAGERRWLDSTDACGAAEGETDGAGGDG